MSPLPFAPPPKDSNLYQQLESTTLQTLTADQLDTIRAKTFSQGTEGNEDEYRRLLLLGLAADQLSLSGPLPGTSINVQGETSSSGSGNDILLYQAAEGEVWAIQGLGIENTATGNPTIYAFLEDAAGVRAYFVVDGVGGSPWSADDEFGAPIYLDSNMSFRFYAFLSGGFGTGESATVTANLIRVR